MRNVLATTALATLLALPATAEMATTDSFITAPEQSHIRASDFIGMRVYMSEAELENRTYTQAETDWDDIGEINDVLLDRNGEVAAVLVDVGGFLGIGEKTVALRMDSVKMISENDDRDDYFVVLKGDRALMEKAPAYTHEGMHDPAMTTYPYAPEIERTGYTAVPATNLTAEKLDGAPVYDAHDEWIGEVSKLLISDDGKIERAVVDVGGFLGLGEKPVALEFTSLSILQDSDGNDLRVYVAATEEQLKDMQTYSQ